jgi:hypothetical protein
LIVPYSLSVTPQFGIHLPFQKDRQAQAMNVLVTLHALQTRMKREGTGNASYFELKDLQRHLSAQDVKDLPGIVARLTQNRPQLMYGTVYPSGVLYGWLTGEGVKRAEAELAKRPGTTLDSVLQSNGGA